MKLTDLTISEFLDLAANAKKLQGVLKQLEEAEGRGVREGESLKNEGAKQLAAARIKADGIIAEAEKRKAAFEDECIKSQEKMAEETKALNQLRASARAEMRAAEKRLTEAVAMETAMTAREAKLSTGEADFRERRRAFDEAQKILQGA